MRVHLQGERTSQHMCGANELVASLLIGGGACDHTAYVWGGGHVTTQHTLGGGHVTTQPTRGGGICPYSLLGAPRSLLPAPAACCCQPLELPSSCMLLPATASLLTQLLTAPACYCKPLVLKETSRYIQRPATPDELSNWKASIGNQVAWSQATALLQQYYSTHGFGITSRNSAVRWACVRMRGGLLRHD